MKPEEINRSETLKTLADFIWNFRLDIMRNMLKQCTPEQQEFFHRLHGDIDKFITIERVLTAIQQLENTIKKNQAVK